LVHKIKGSYIPEEMTRENQFRDAPSLHRRLSVSPNQILQNQ
jgi:hypothetical protein